MDPLLGTDLGGITITRLLGEGGMGRVYEARQKDPPRTVAVKVIRQGIASEKTMRRFEREAEFLGRLQHPGIARIYVVGSYSSDDGDVPFFVTEFVANARPINHYASEHNLSLADRLKLFVSVCEAVSHGHDRGIIHRDLKPGNILIDSNGLPKVIDFGVARSTDSDFSLTSMKTDTGALVGTVQYMSPEQFGDSPEGLDGRADVYSLGVVLYELIAGALPYEVRKKKMHEAARIICEEIPTSLRSRDRRIPGDVSLIVERCLEKNRRLRYQGAAALAADLKRHLAGERIPLSCKDVLRPYVHFLRRRGAALLVGSLGLALVAVLALATWLAVQEAGRARQPNGTSDPGKLPIQVQESLTEATDRGGDAAGQISAAIAESRRQIQEGAIRIHKQACSRQLVVARADLEATAAGCERKLHAAWVRAAEAYPAAHEGDLAKRHAQWATRLESVRERAAAAFFEVERACAGLVQGAQEDLAIEGLAAIKQVEQEIKARVAAWLDDANDQITRLHAEAATDLWAYARESAGAGNERK